MSNSDTCSNRRQKFESLKCRKLHVWCRKIPELIIYVWRPMYRYSFWKFYLTESENDFLEPWAQNSISLNKNILPKKLLWSHKKKYSISVWATDTLMKFGLNSLIWGSFCKKYIFHDSSKLHIGFKNFFNFNHFTTWSITDLQQEGNRG